MQTRHGRGDVIRWSVAAIVCACALACLTGCPTSTPKADPDFMAWPTSGTAPLAVQFVDVSSVAQGRSILRWWWDFGDSGIDTVRDPMHTFVEAGTYDVKLTIDTLGEDASGNTEVLSTQITKTQFITVAAPGSDPVGTVVPGEMVPVDASEFNMGATDAEKGATDEYPRHHVTLSKYDIGKFEVTNKEYADALNALLAADAIYDASGTAYGGGDVYGHGQLLLGVSSGYCQIAFTEGRFVPKVRDGRSMENHPVVMVTWYGAAVFCNQLSAVKGIAPYYDPETWSASTAGANGYRLPTEAEWERAAAWNAGHWVYGFSSNIIDVTRCTYALMESGQTAYYPNPAGLSIFPYTTPIGYYNGTNGTLNRPSPVRCYDMSGNVLEWCSDWYGLYTAEERTNPRGATSGDTRVVRGGSWFDDAYACRTAHRGSMMPGRTFMFLGFRTARTL